MFTNFDLVDRILSSLNFCGNYNACNCQVTVLYSERTSPNSLHMPN